MYEARDTLVSQRNGFVVGQENTNSHNFQFKQEKGWQSE